MLFLSKYSLTQLIQHNSLAVNQIIAGPCLCLVAPTDLCDNHNANHCVFPGQFLSHFISSLPRNYPLMGSMHFDFNHFCHNQWITQSSDFSKRNCCLLWQGHTVELGICTIIAWCIEVLLFSFTEHLVLEIC